MRNLIAPAALALGLMVGSAAFAAAPPAATTPAKPAATAPAKPAATATKPTTASKKAACEKSWNSQKTHTGDKASFVKVCVAKG